MNMLLIIFLGLIAKLASVSGDCDVRTGKVHNFDPIKFTGPSQLWYFYLYNPNTFEDNLDCAISTFETPKGNTSVLSCQAYVISEKNYMTLNATVTNWKRSGYFEVYNFPPTWNGGYYVIYINYKSYAILKHCRFDTKETNVYVLTTNPKPNKATRRDIQLKLQQNKIDVSNLAKFKNDHCPPA